jgi:hypothetical protein
MAADRRVASRQALRLPAREAPMNREDAIRQVLDAHRVRDGQFTCTCGQRNLHTWDDQAKHLAAEIDQALATS